MFFLSFTGSIRIFTLFLNLLNSEIFLIPAIILLTVLVLFWHWIKWDERILISTQDSSAKVPE
jgi:hypothetical protein